jgi:gamma-glutamyltranspeptidase/glutathione hydrolase
MIHPSRSYRGMVVAPHRLAAEAGARVLRDGGNAVEAMIAAASTIAVVYPHMNSLGGDNFWLLQNPGDKPLGIDACGAAAGVASVDFYREQQLDAIPGRGPLAALTAAGAVSGWAAAYQLSREQMGGKLPLARLLEDAIFHAQEGVAVPETLAHNIAGKLPELESQPGYAEAFLRDGVPYQTGERFVQSRIAATLQALVDNGLDDFYRGDLARSIARDLESAGSPLRQSDLEQHQPLQVTPLSLRVSGHDLYNMPPPTQGLASLMLLGIFEKLGIRDTDNFEYIHGLIESTKQAFLVRDSEVSDPAYMKNKANDFLQDEFLSKLASNIDRNTAAPWPAAPVGGDTVWLGAIDQQGRSVSFIQSIYWEFGSGVVLPETGIVWQNRGTSFSLDSNHHNCLQPGRRPFHTIQPAHACLDDGRVMPYGTMGGEGQPQTQAMVFSRYVYGGQNLQRAVSAPRWLLGKTWGSDITNLRIENRFPDEVYQALIDAGHDVEVIGDFDEVMGHAGALVRHPDGLIEGASDPRSDGAAIGL